MRHSLGLTREMIVNLWTFLTNPKNVIRCVHIISSHWDPDSIACAILMRTIFRFFGWKSIEIHIPGEPTNYVQNKEIVEHFGLKNEISKLGKDFNEKVGKDDVFVFVDTPDPNDARFPCGKMPRPNIVIDHHARPADMISKGDDEWYWYGSHGACVSMVTALMILLKVFQGMEEKQRMNLATLGMLGISADTRKITSRHMGALDYPIVGFLGQYVDQDVIEKISSSKYSETFLDALGIPRSRWKRKGTTLLFRSEGNDSIQGSEYNMLKITELLMSLGEVQTLYVWTVRDNYVLVKARNSDKKLDLDKELKRIFGNDKGGAKDKSSGGAQIDMGPLWDVPEGDKERFLDLCESWMRRKIFEK